MADRAGVQKGPKQLAFRFAEKGQEAGGPLGRVLGEGVDVLHESVCAVHDAVREEGAGISRLMTSFTGEMAGLTKNLGEAKGALDALKTEVSGGNAELGERLSGLATRVSEVQAALEKAVVGALESVRSSTLEAVETGKVAVTGAVAESEARVTAGLGQTQVALEVAVERKTGETNLGVAKVFVAVQAVATDVKAVLAEFADAEDGKVNLLIGAVLSISDRIDGSLDRLGQINSALEAQAMTLAVHTEALGRIEHAVGAVESVAGRVLQESAAVREHMGLLERHVDANMGMLERQVDVLVSQGDGAEVRAYVDANVAALKAHVDGAVTLVLGEFGKLRGQIAEGLGGVVAAVNALRLPRTPTQEVDAVVIEEPAVEPTAKPGKVAGPAPAAVVEAEMEAAPNIHEMAIRQLAEAAGDLARLHSYALMKIDGQTKKDAKLAIDALEELKATDVLFSVRQQSADVELAQQAGAAFERVASLKDRLTLEGDEVLISMFLHPETAPERKGEILNLFLEEKLRMPILQIYMAVEGDDKQSVRAALDKFDKDAIVDAKNKVAGGDSSGSAALLNYASMFVEAQSEESARLAITALEESKDVEALRTVQLNLSDYFDLEALTTQAMERLTPKLAYDAGALLNGLRNKKDKKILESAIEAAGEYAAPEAIPELFYWLDFNNPFRKTREDENALAGVGHISLMAEKALGKIGLSNSANAELVAQEVVTRLESLHEAGFVDVNKATVINLKALFRLASGIYMLVPPELQIVLKKEITFVKKDLAGETGDMTRVTMRDAAQVVAEADAALASIPNGK